MNINAFGDPKKLADARALARTFKTGEHSNFPKNGRVSSRRGRDEDAAQLVEAREFVPPSQRHYNGNVLEKGWQIRGSSLNTPVMSSAMDFLRRADQAPEFPGASEADTLVVDNPAASTSNGQKNNDEVNVEKLSDLLNSFSFKEATGEADDASGSILETFLALLAESTNLPPELGDAKDSCVKRSKPIDGDDDESGKVEASPKAKSVQQGSKSRASTPSPKKNTQLQPDAPPFVLCGPQVAKCVHEG
ncbi:hypothetical protein E4U53_004307 [Claviceps sorghi]|nr:hypothetical protein E4U53_004307 [Claviceps sorghi]